MTINLFGFGAIEIKYTPGKMHTLHRDVRRLLRREDAGRGKIAAIKLYREVTGMGLLESKEAVEEIQREMDNN